MRLLIQGAEIEKEMEAKAEMEAEVEEEIGAELEVKADRASSSRQHLIILLIRSILFLSSSIVIECRPHGVCAMSAS